MPSICIEQCLWFLELSQYFFKWQVRSSLKECDIGIVAFWVEGGVNAKEGEAFLTKIFFIFWICTVLLDSSPVPSVSKLGLEEEEKNQEEKKNLNFCGIAVSIKQSFWPFKKGKFLMKRTPIHWPVPAFRLRLNSSGFCVISKQYICFRETKDIGNPNQTPIGVVSLPFTFWSPQKDGMNSSLCSHLPPGDICNGHLS